MTVRTDVHPVRGVPARQTPRGRRRIDGGPSIPTLHRIGCPRACARRDATRQPPARVPGLASGRVQSRAAAGGRSVARGGWSWCEWQDCGRRAAGEGQGGMRRDAHGGGGSWKRRHLLLLALLALLAQTTPKPRPVTRCNAAPRPTTRGAHGAHPHAAPTSPRSRLTPAPLTTRPPPPRPPHPALPAHRTCTRPRPHHGRQGGSGGSRGRHAG